MEINGSVSATREGHKLKDATKEEIGWIFRIYHKNNLKQYLQLLNHAEKPPSEPDALFTKQ